MRRREGSFLVESIVALSLVVTGILGIIVLFTRSMGLTANVSQRAVATYLAADGIEVVKSIIDTEIARPGGAWPNSLQEAAEVTYDSVGTPGTHPLEWRSTQRLRLQANGTYSYETAGVVTPFQRTVLIESLGSGEEIKVNSVVTWSVKGTPEMVDIEDRFWNWRR